MIRAVNHKINKPGSLEPLFNMAMKALRVPVVENEEDDDTVLTLYGDTIYPFIEKFSNADDAPKITGMIMDTGRGEMVTLTWKGLMERIKEGQQLLREEEKEDDDNYVFNTVSKQLEEDGIP